MKYTDLSIPTELRTFYIVREEESNMCLSEDGSISGNYSYDQLIINDVSTLVFTGIDNCKEFSTRTAALAKAKKLAELNKEPYDVLQVKIKTYTMYVYEN